MMNRILRMSLHWSVLAVAASLLAIAPLFLTTYPPMVDVSQYAAQVNMFNQIASGGWRFSSLFGVELFTPYLTSFLLIWLIEPITGMVAAAKIVVCLSVFSLPLSTAILLKEFKADPFWCWLVVPASYGFAFVWGFLNFLIAAPLGMMLLVIVSWYTRRPGLLSGLAVAIATHLLFFSHALTLFFFGALAGVLILVRAPSIGRAIVLSMPLLSLAPVGLIWGLHSIAQEQAQTFTIWDLRWTRIIDIPSHVLGAQTDAGLALLFLGIMAVPLLAGCRPTRDLARYIPLLLCLLILLFMPNRLFGTFFTYHRFAIFLIPLYLLIMEPAPRSHRDISSRRRKLAQIGAVVIAAASTANASIRFSGYEKENEDFREILGTMAPDQRVLSLVFEPRSRFSMAPIYLHYPVWYQAENGGLVDFNFATWLGEPVHYLPSSRPPAGDSFVWRPYTFDWADHRDYGYTYVLARTGSDPALASMTFDSCNSLTLAAHAGTWWLYEARDLNVVADGCQQGDTTQAVPPETE